MLNVKLIYKFVKIKNDAVICQDFRIMKWPRCLNVEEGEDINITPHPDRVFICSFPDVNCIAPGFGVLNEVRTYTVDGIDISITGEYGNGGIFVLNKDKDVEIVTKEDFDAFYNRVICKKTDIKVTVITGSTVGCDEDAEYW